MKADMHQNKGKIGLHRAVCCVCAMLLFLGMCFGAPSYALESETRAVDEKGLIEESDQEYLKRKKTSSIDESAPPPTVKEDSPKESEEPLFPLRKDRLSEEDFRLGYMALGDDISSLEKQNETKWVILRGNASDEYHRDGLTVSVNHALPYQYGQRADLHLQYKPSSDGIVRMYADKSGIETTRGIQVGSRRENVLRVYGVPENVLWDGKNGTFHFIYEMVGKKLTFAIKNDKVFSFTIEYIQPTARGNQKNLKDKDFSLAGFSVGQIFREHPWDVWEKKMTNPQEEIWYFTGYAVRERTAGHGVEGIFITDTRMVTSRGLTMGDDVSTAEALYGKPGKLEMDMEGGNDKAAYVYFSSQQKKVLLIYIQNEKVEGIVVMNNPVQEKSF